MFLPCVVCVSTRLIKRLRRPSHCTPRLRQQCEAWLCQDQHPRKLPAAAHKCRWAPSCRIKQKCQPVMPARIVPKAPRQSTKGLWKINSLQVDKKIFELAKRKRCKTKNLGAGGTTPASAQRCNLGWSQAGHPPGGLLLRQGKPLKFSFPSPAMIKHILLSTKHSRTSKVAISNCISYSQPPTISGFCHYLLPGKSKESPVKCLIYFRSRRSLYPM